MLITVIKVFTCLSAYFIAIIYQLLITAELEALDEEDAYLAQAVFDHMQVNDNGVGSLRIGFRNLLD